MYKSLPVLLLFTLNAFGSIPAEFLNNCGLSFSHLSAEQISVCDDVARKDGSAEAAVPEAVPVKLVKGYSESQFRKAMGVEFFHRLGKINPELKTRLCGENPGLPKEACTGHASSIAKDLQPQYYEQKPSLAPAASQDFWREMEQRRQLKNMGCFEEMYNTYWCDGQLHYVR
jgi:hypothetical protein